VYFLHLLRTLSFAVIVSDPTRFLGVLSLASFLLPFAGLDGSVFLSLELSSNGVVLGSVSLLSGFNSFLGNGREPDGVFEEGLVLSSGVDTLLS